MVNFILFACFIFFYRTKMLHASDTGYCIKGSESFGFDIAAIHHMNIQAVFYTRSSLTGRYSNAGTISPAPFNKLKKGAPAAAHIKHPCIIFYAEAVSNKSVFLLLSF